MNQLNESILKGAQTAFIDENSSSSSDFTPQLLSNSFGNKVLNSIKSELHNCDEFSISVAFITMGGLTPLLQDFKELKDKGIKGRILTTDYLNFTEPKALKKLNELDNIEVKLYPQEEHGFHTKGYLFKKNNLYKGIIGSSNLTLNALTVNKEWNLKFSSADEGEVLLDLQKEFNQLWSEAKDLSDILPQYEQIYNAKKKFNALKQTYNELKPEIKKDLVPNSMQVKFLENLREIYKKDESRALLISATGTGKTYASAFAVKDFNPKKFLFLVHREQIANQAIKAYKNVFQEEKFGLFTGSHKDYNKDYLFATIQTMSKDDYLYKFQPDEFDYIVIDEVHKAGANSYIKVMNYFKPKFYLGMSASPDRTDSFDIYDLFDHNIAHEIRLQEALNLDLLCPFHYFGITDLEINGETNEDNLDNFAYLTSSQRVDYLLEKSEYYGYSGDRIKALVFTSRKREARELAEAFNKRGHPSIVLTGEDSQKTREEAIYRLTDDEAKDKLEYIFTVDVFNEGVDIPEINQVMLVRPTQSSIIFIQQLGRGLRKFNNKEYVVVLDFIGNYKNNFMIPIALSGDRTYDKDLLRHYLMEGNRIIPGASSISFDEISKERIYKSITNASFTRKALFKEKYQNLKFKLGRIPYLVDFYENGELDPMLILNHTAYDCYYSFLKEADKDYDEYLSDEEIQPLKFISKVLADGKRPHELLILKSLIYNNYFSLSKIEELLDEEYHLKNQSKSIESALNIFSFDFFTKAEIKKYAGADFFDNEFKINKKFKEFLSKSTFRKHLNDVIDYALLKYKIKYNKPTEEVNLALYEKYSRKDACRLLNWPHDDSSTIYGYRVKHNTCPIFVTYDKHEDISKSTMYQDEFISSEVFSWMTRSRLTLESKEVQKIINYDKTDLKLHLFIKKSDDEGKDFYYMGQVTPFNWAQTTIEGNKGESLPIVNFQFKMHNPIKEDLFSYFTKDFTLN